MRNSEIFLASSQGRLEDSYDLIAVSKRRASSL